MAVQLVWLVCSSHLCQILLISALCLAKFSFKITHLKHLQIVLLLEMNWHQLRESEVGPLLLFSGYLSPENIVPRGFVPF